MEQVGLLCDHADGLAQRLQLDPAYVETVDLQGSAVHVVEPRHQVRHRGLAGTRRPDQRGELSRLDVEVNALEGPQARGLVAVAGRRLRRDRRHGVRRRHGRVVAEPHVVEADLPPQGVPRQRHRALRVRDLVRHVQVLEDPLEQRERRVDLDGDLQHRADGEEEPALQGGERDQGPRGEAGPQERGPAAVEHVARHQVHERRHGREEDLHDGAEASADHLLADQRAGEPLVLSAEPIDLVPLPPERLREEDPAHAEGLLGDGRHIGEGPLRARRDFTPRLTHLDGQPDEDRHHEQGEERQRDGYENHGEQRRQDDHDVRQDRRGGVRHDGLHPTNIVRQPRLDLAGPRGGEESKGHPLEVRVEGIA